MLLETIQKDLVIAMKAGDQIKVSTLRFLLSDLKKYEIDTYPPATGKSLTEDDVVKIIRRQVKTHKESIEAFQNAKRIDLVTKESEELKILQNYIPKELSDQEIKVIVESVKAKGINSFGQMMAAVMKEIAGRADGRKVAQVVKEVLEK